MRALGAAPSSAGIHQRKMRGPIVLSIADISRASPEWSDLDVVGISGRIPLTKAPPTAVMSVAAMEVSSTQVLRNYLVPPADRNPGPPMVFAEYGGLGALESFADPGHWGSKGSCFWTARR